MPFFKNKSIYDDILEFSKQQTLFNLLESGVDVNFFEPILEVLNSSVASSSDVNDLVDELKSIILGEGEGVGLLQRYVSQVSNDSISQFNATYNQTVTQDLGIEFYNYTGTVIAGTREFCDNFVRKYFHKKEVELMGSGINPITGKTLKSEGLVAGRIKSTNKSNIFINRGGWNCRHFFSPITPRFVPKKDLIRNISNGNWKPTKREMQLLK